MVTIIDPHLKRVSNYPVYQRASELGVFVKPKDGGGEYEGWCWPGSSSWIDFFHPTSWSYWKNLFKTTKHEKEWTWTQSTDSIHIWNDMNEVESMGPFTRMMLMPSSLLSLMAPSLPCRRIIFITEVGSTVMYITSTG